VGKFTGTDITFGAITAPLEELRNIYRNSFAETFA
jgi:phosphoribosylformylglycinamidine synthase